MDDNKLEEGTDGSQLNLESDGIDGEAKQEYQPQDQQAYRSDNQDPYKDPYQNQYQDPYQNQYRSSYQNPYQDEYAPQGGYSQELEEPVSMGDWLVSMLLIMFLPCANIVLLFVWAFNKKEKKSKSNFCKAFLIIAAIQMVLLFFFLIIIVGGFITAGILA